MKTKLNAVASILCGGLLLIGGLAFGVQANAANPHRGSDQVQSLSDQVHNKLVLLPWYSVFDDLKYQVNGSEITLTGQVTLPVTRINAEREVEHIPGVTSVVDNIKVLPLSTFDDQTRRAEFRAIYSQPRLSRYNQGAVPQIHIIVANGHVTLEGTVANAGDKDVASIAANQVPGVFSVTNNLQIG